MVGGDLPEIGAKITGEIADLMAKIETVKMAIKDLRKEASGRTDLVFATELDKALTAFSKRARSGIIKKSIEDAVRDANVEVEGRNAAQRFANAWRQAIKKEKFTVPGWATAVGIAMPAAPALIAGLAGAVGGLATAGFAAAAGLGALAFAAKDVLGPVKTAYATFDKLTSGGSIAANATALQTWLTGSTTTTRTRRLPTRNIAGLPARIAASQLRILADQARIAAAKSPAARLNAEAALIAQQGILAGLQSRLAAGPGGGVLSTTTTTRNALGPGLGFLTNPNLNWYTLSPAQQRAAVIAAQKTTGMPTAERAQLAALMQERQAYQNLNPQQQQALFQRQRFGNAVSAAQDKSQPIILQLYAKGLQTLTPLLKYLPQLAQAAGTALLPLLSGVQKITASTGFKAFMDQLISLAHTATAGFGTALLNVGVGLMNIFTGISKSGLATTMVNDVVKMAKSFATWTGGKGFTTFLAEMKTNAPVVVDILKQLFLILGRLVTTLGGGLGTAELKFLDALLKILANIAKIPGLGAFVYNLIAMELVFSKFGSIKATLALWDLLYKSLFKLVGLKFGAFVAGLIGVETEGMTVGQVWGSIGKRVWSSAVMALQAMGNWIKGAVIWAGKMIISGVTVAASWIAEAAVAAGAWVAANATMILVSGGIVLLLAAIVLGVYELIKHWKTVWKDVKKVAEDAWRFMWDGWGKYLLPLLGPAGLIILGVIEVWKHWKTIWGWIKDTVDGIWKGIKYITGLALSALLTEPGYGILWWAKQIIHGVTDAFGWVPIIGPALKSADKTVGDWIKTINNTINGLQGKNVNLNFTATVTQAGGGNTGLPYGTVGKPKPKPKHKAAGGVAAPGWSWVGEMGPELTYFHGGETVLSNSQSRQVTRGYAGGTAPGFSASVSPIGLFQAAISSVELNFARTIGQEIAKGVLAATGSGGGSTGAFSQSAAVAQAYAKSLLGGYGWGATQFSPLVMLWNQESGWRWNATNPSSGAYGIPQSLPASKMASAGADWRTNYQTQIRWGLGYIKSTYGSPTGAWAHEQLHNWYGGGGTIPMGSGGIVGDSGLEAVTVGPGGARVTPLGGGGGRPIYISVRTNEINPVYHAAQLGWELARRSSD